MSTLKSRVVGPIKCYQSILQILNVIFWLQKKKDKEEKKEDEADKGKKENDEGRRTPGRTRRSLGLIGYIIGY